MSKKNAAIANLTRFLAVAGLVLTVMMMAVPANIQAAAPSAPVAATEAITCQVHQPGPAAAKDAWINQDKTSENKNDSELRVKTESGKRNHSLIQFDLSTAVPTNAQISSATLSLYVKDVRDGDSTVRARQLLNSWSETGVTWDSRNKDLSLNWSTPGGDYNTGVTLDSENFLKGVKDYFATFNVTTAAQAWAANPATNHGVLLEAGVTNPKSEIRFKSSGDGTASQRPQLEICFLLGPSIGDNTLTQGASGQTRSFAHIITTSDFSEVVNLSALSDLGWTVRFYADVNQDGVKDNNTPITQTPLLGKNATYGIVVEVDVPDSAPNGTKDTVTIKVTGANSNTFDTVINYVGVGFGPPPPPVLDGRRDAAYTESLNSTTQDYCAAPGEDGAGTVMARTMTLFDVNDPDYIWVVLEMNRSHADNAYGTYAHPTWAEAGKSWSLNSMIGSDKAQVLLRDTNGTLIFDVTADYLASGLPTLSGYGSAGVTGGNGSIAVGNAAFVAVESSMGYNMNRFCTGSGQCTVQGINLVNTSPQIDVNYVPVNPFFNDWQFSYLYEYRFAASAFGAAGFGSATINNVHVSPNKTGSNEIIVVPCGGSIGDRVWFDKNGDGVQDAGEEGINGVQLRLYQDNGDGVFNAMWDIPLKSIFTSGDGGYLFSGLGPGAYWVKVVEGTVPDEYLLTTGNDPMLVQLGLGQNFLDADFGYRSMPDVALSKTLNSADPAFVGTEIEFLVTVTNTGNTRIDFLPLQDFYDPAALQFVSAVPAPSSTSAGVITWDDLTTTQGNLSVGESTTVVIRFLALQATSSITTRALQTSLDGAAPADTGAAGSSGQSFELVPFSLNAGLEALSVAACTAPFDNSVYLNTSNCKCVKPTAMTVRYLGAGPTTITIAGNGTGGPFTNINTGDTFTIGVTGNEPTFTATGQPTQAIHTSCSAPLYPGWTSRPVGQDKSTQGGPFEVVSFSTNGVPFLLASPSACSLGSIGDRVIVGTTVPDTGSEPGVSGVTVNLYGGSCPTDPAKLTAAGQFKTTTTNGNGVYTFSGLIPGEYCAAVATGSVPVLYQLSTAGSLNAASNGNVVTTCDFALEMVGTGSIGDRVFYDLDGSGLPDGGVEPGLNDVTVNLYQGACPVGNTGVPFQTTVTSGNGDYLFGNLPAGGYCVNVDESTLPTDLALTTNNEPHFKNLADDETYLLADFGYRAQAPDKTCDLASVSVAVDQHGNSAPARYDDACVEIRPAQGAIGDFVWYDTNADGIQNVGEPGIPNVTLDIYLESDGAPGLDLNTDTLVASTVTDADGGYLFSNLPPGTYYVDVTDQNGVLTGLTHIVANQSLPDPTGAIVLPVGGVYKDADFGYVREPEAGKAIVGDTVWYDANGDGVQQPSEPGIPNVTVTVYDSNNNPIGTADTDENGRYLIEVPAGSGYTASPDPADIPAGLTATTPVPHLLPPLNPGDHYLDADFGYTDGNNNLLGSIGDLVFEDVNKNGVFTNGVDRPLPGVSVSLIRDVDGDKVWGGGEPIIATVTTDQNGTYLFTGLPAGDYLVHVSDTNAVLINYVKGPLGAAGVNNNSQADPYAITLAPGQDNLTADFGYIKLDPRLGVIGNQVWVEMDTNGLYNPAGTDVGQAGVTVDLYRNGTFYATTTTGASGDYSFVKLPSGTYTVQVSDNFGVLDGYLVTTLGPNQGQDNNNQLQPYQIVLPLGGENLTADFGYTLKGAIGDFVWYDADADGIQDVGEPGIGNVTLNLYKDNGDNVLNTAQDTLIGTATTDTDGGYLFTGLAQGVYFVDVTDANGVLTGLTHTVGPQSQPDPSNPIVLNVGDTYRDADFGYVRTPDTGKAIIGDTVWYDGDGDGIQDPGEPGIPGIQVCATPVGGGVAVCDITDENGRYQVEVPAGTYTVAPTNPPAGYTATTPVPHGPVTVSPGDQYLDADFGYTKPGELGTISGTLWDDTPNKNGLLEPGEDPIPGVSVSLIRDTNNNGRWDPGEPIIATDTTDVNGDYLFQGVPPGRYLVLPTDTQNVLDDFSPTVLGPNPGQDNNNQVQPYPVNLPAGGSNSTGDFGYVRSPGNETGMIGNQVWYEVDGNGIFNPESGDKGVAGVTVDLFKDGIFFARTTTGAGGDYVFTGLAAGSYTVMVSDNAQVLQDYILTALGPNPGQDNNNQAQAYQVILPVAGSNMTADFGYTRPSSIGDLVWYDADGDGIQDVGEPGIPNVTLNLIRDGAVVATTVTGADGGYIFPGLVAGDYIVDVTDTNGVLTGLTQIVANQGQPDPTGVITLGAGVKYADADFAYVDVPTPGSAIIGDTVWYDDNGDGVQQPNEPGIPGIQVCATPVGGGAAICATTDDNGIYRLEVPAGTYTVQPTNPPGGLTATTPVPHGPVVVEAGDQYLDADFGYDDPGQNLLGAIGNLVFAEAKATRDGIFNGNDQPLAGVSVDLIRDSNANRVWDAGEPIIATATTDQNGNYLFTGLPAGNYLVSVSDTNAVLLDYIKTVLGPNQRQDNNNQVDPYWIALAQGGENLTADFGYYRAERPNVGVIGNQVWTESDGDGLFAVNSGDVGQAGVTVELRKDGVLYATTTSGPSGDYSFVGLPAGNYSVRVTDDLKVLAGYIVTQLGPNPGADNNNQAQPYAIALPTGGVNLTGDFGYVQPGAIGDFVWYDTNADGIQNIDEPGIPNVALNLYRDSDNSGTLTPADELIASTVTDADGGYLFPNLVPGKYIVDVVDASNPNGKLGDLVHTLGNQSATDPTPVINLLPGVAYKDADFGYVKEPLEGNVIIGDTVWYDANGDGFQQPEEIGIPGVTVRATDGNGNIYDTVTDQNGRYLFELPQGAYSVSPVNPPASLTPTTSPTWGPVVLVAGDQRLDADFGYTDNGTLLGSIGNLVFWDKNRDGFFNIGDAPLGGVSVALIRDLNGNRVWDAGEPIIATATTKSTVDASAGNYLFPGVPAGNYLVHVSDTNAVLFDFEKSVLGPNQAANNQNKADPYAIALGVNQDNLTADFGYYRQPDLPKVGVIGNQIWVEIDPDGLFDVLKMDEGQPGVTVDLYKGGILVATTTSGASGDYSFVHLPKGVYTVTVSDREGVLTGRDVTTLGPNQGADNNNQLQPYTVNLPEGGINLTADFGYKDDPGTGQSKSSIGNLVWADSNNNGRYNAGEAAIGGAVVRLWYDADMNCVLDPTKDVFVGSRTTVSTLGIGNTNYIFEYENGLRTGNYLVEVTDPNSVLVGATKTVGLNVGVNENSQPNPYCIQNFNATGLGDTNLTADFGYLLPESRFTVSKVRLSPSPVRPSEAVQFAIRVTNTGTTQFMVLPLEDVYDTEYLRFVSAVLAPVDTTDDGTLNWTDLLSGRDPLLPGEQVEVIVNFVALKDTGDLPNSRTVNTAVVSGIITDPDGNGPAPTNPTPLPPQSSQDVVVIINPTAVQIAGTNVALADGGAVVRWQTVSEADVAGFNLLRAEGEGSSVAVNEGAIPAQKAGQAEGAAYEWVDVTAQSGMAYTYSLEIIRLDGSVERYALGSVAPNASGQLIFLPLISR